MGLESKKPIDGKQEKFEEAKYFIEFGCGIKLTQIELVGLRRITMKVIEEKSQQEKMREQEKLSGKEIPRLDNLNYRSEIITRFMHQFYDVNLSDVKTLSGKDGEILKEYFRRAQAKAHLP